MKLFWVIAVAIGAAISGAFTALMRIWKIGPFLPQDHEITDFSTPPEAPNSPQITVSHPNAPIVVMSSPEAVGPIIMHSPIYNPPMPKNMLDTFCHGIAQMEGANPANNNPGNCRCSPVGYVSMYGNVTCNPHNFAVFPTKELGWMYLENLVHHRVNLHPTWTFVDFFENYAPSSDGNDPHHYANWMADYCKVPVDTVLAKLFS